MDLINLAVKTIFIENIVLAYFLGMCSFLACSKKIETATGLGMAVICVLGLTVPFNWFIETYFLMEGAMAWTGVQALAALDLSFLNLLSFIAVIACTVQVVEMVLDRFFPKLYHSLGIFLPLITVNCAILGGSLFMVERQYTLAESAVYGVSSGAGFALAIVSIAALRKKIRYSDIPPGLQGLGMTMILTGLMSMAFMCFAGIDL